MDDLISVIVPVYNVERYLKRCVDSILNQTYKNLEIILVDDGSTDRSGDICDEYKKIDYRIKVIHQTNRGLSGARNSGIDIAGGKYIGCVDSDDYIHPQMYEKLHELILSTKADMAVCGYRQIYDESFRLYPVGDANIEVHTGFEAMENLFHEPFEQIYWVEAWNKLYSRWIFDTIRYPEGVNFEDNYIFHRILDLVNTVSYTHEKLLYYFQRTDSIVRENYSLKKMDELKAFESRVRYFEEKGYYKLKEKACFAWMERLTGHYQKLSSLKYGKVYQKQIKNKIKDILNREKWIRQYRKQLLKYRLFIICAPLFFFLKSRKNRERD